MFEVQEVFEVDERRRVSWNSVEEDEFKWVCVHKEEDFSQIDDEYKNGYNLQDRVTKHDWLQILSQITGPDYVVISQIFSYWNLILPCQIYFFQNDYDWFFLSSIIKWHATSISGINYNYTIPIQ